MTPNKKLSLVVLVLALLSAGFVSGRYPSPYVDDWAFIVGPTTDLRAGDVDCDPVLAAMKAAGLKRFIYGAGTYLHTPNGGIAISGGDNESYEGAGPGATTLVSKSGQTGTLITLGNDSAVRNLRLLAFDGASTIGARMASNKHRGTLENVEVVDFETGVADGNAIVVDGFTLRGCKLSSCAHGFRTAAASTNIVIEACTISDNTSGGLSLQASPNGGRVSGNRFSGNLTAIAMGSCSNYTINGNSFLSGTNSITISTGARNAIGDNHFAFGAVAPSNVTNQQCSLRGRYYGTASPSAGTWLTGDVVHNSTPGSSGATPVKWVCSVGGTSGTWQPVYRGLPATVVTNTWDPPSMADGAGTSKSDFAVTGAAFGNRVNVAAPYEIPAGVMITASVVGANTVRVSLHNHSGGVVDLGSGPWTIEVTQ